MTIVSMTQAYVLVHKLRGRADQLISPCLLHCDDNPPAFRLPQSSGLCHRFTTRNSRNTPDLVSHTDGCSYAATTPYVHLTPHSGPLAPCFMISQPSPGNHNPSEFSPRRDPSCSSPKGAGTQQPSRSELSTSQQIMNSSSTSCQIALLNPIMAWQPTHATASTVGGNRVLARAPTSNDSHDRSNWRYLQMVR